MDGVARPIDSSEAKDVSLAQEKPSISRLIERRRRKQQQVAKPAPTAQHESSNQSAATTRMKRLQALRSNTVFSCALPSSLAASVLGSDDQTSKPLPNAAKVIDASMYSS
jgi:hypothetical protein